ncbi:uncharacterized protein LOC105924704 isoform X2 [Fundulus heteroclitus]|uniref:uncharacterized protein LOC105924704 isoform X2 n=1 Tax=Fundulus heteroclitus TaxID=8078 RepID=UPI00165C935A|nr:uncharacterized protein LOC105924704 isoform X2 [Fundulus heteroclitus]
MTVITFFCSILLLSLQISSSRTKDAVTHYGVPGRTIKVRCSFSSSGERMIFCKQNCEEKGDILIETRKTTDRKGRYSITSVKGQNEPYFNVSISSLTQSDSGRYRCGLSISSSKFSYKDFILVVAEALLDGNKDHDFSKEAGSSLTVACSFDSSGRIGRFCKEECEKDENVLVESSGDRVETDRYILEYRKEREAVLLVTIKQLTQSDSGPYQCQLDIALRPDSYRDFTVSVTDVDQSTSTTTTSRSFSSSFTHATTRQSFSSSSAGFTPSRSSETTKHLGLEEKSSSDVLLIVGVTLAFIIIVLAVALLVFCRKRSERRRKDPSVKSENTPATTTEVRDNENTSAAVQISPIHSYASYCTTAGAEGNDIYSLVTAVPPQNSAEDDLGKPTYAQLSFPNRSSDSPPRPSGPTDVVYSLPVVAGGRRAGEESLYSNTT